MSYDIDAKSKSKRVGKFVVPQEYSLPTDFINRAELLLPYKTYAKKQCKKKFLEHIRIKIEERYKIANTNLLTKLKTIDNDLEHVLCTTDYDEEFFNIVNGRPIPHCIPLYKSLTSVFNSRFRILQEIGFKKDSALKIDMNIKVEKKIFDLSMQRILDQANCFDKFVMEDYKKSMKLLEDGEKLNFVLDTKINELHSLADESFSIKSRLLALDYKFSLQQKYGRFLYYLSPPLWRSNNRDFARSVEIEAKGFDFGNSHDEDTFNVMFEKMRKQCFSSPVKPVLYFSYPHDLLDVFEGMEKQLLYHFSRETQLVPHIKSMKEAIHILKQKNIFDSIDVKSSIDRFRNLLKQCEERSIQLKCEFYKILYGFFYDAVGMVDVLKFMFHLEFCYSKIFDERPINLGMLTIAKAIESMYMDYSKRLDAIQSSTVRKAMKRSIDLNSQKMDLAMKASKELRLFNRLERELLRAYNIISQDDKKVHTETKDISEEILNGNHSKILRRKSNKSLNDAEIEYLTLFTDWTKDEDPAIYLQSYNLEKDKNFGDIGHS